jgi:hypothetical protein
VKRVHVRTDVLAGASFTALAVNLRAGILAGAPYCGAPYCGGPYCLLPVLGTEALRLSLPGPAFCRELLTASRWVEKGFFCLSPPHRRLSSTLLMICIDSDEPNFNY